MKPNSDSEEENGPGEIPFDLRICVGDVPVVYLGGELLEVRGRQALCSLHAALARSCGKWSGKEQGPWCEVEEKFSLRVAPANEAWRLAVYRGKDTGFLEGTREELFWLRDRMARAVGRELMTEVGSVPYTERRQHAPRRELEDRSRINPEDTVTRALAAWGGAECRA